MDTSDPLYIFLLITVIMGAISLVVFAIHGYQLNKNKANILNNQDLMDETRRTRARRVYSHTSPKIKSNTKARLATDSDFDDDEEYIDDSLARLSQARAMTIDASLHSDVEHRVPPAAMDNFVTSRTSSSDYDSGGSDSGNED